MGAKITDPARQLAFLISGRAEFTLHNPETGGRFTYRVFSSKKKDCWYVRVLSGPDNTRHYSYVGLVTKYLKFQPTSRRNRFVAGSDALSSRAFAWMWRRIMKNRDLGPAEFWHVGRCGRCGRKLTVPESIETGIGPVCAGMQF